MMMWVDIETTGLSAKDDQILELGLMLTTDQLVRVAQFEVVVMPARPIMVRSLHPAVREMHEKSGLLDEIAAPHARTLGAAEAMACTWVTELGLADDAEVPLCGSSVHFDRAFLQQHMPTLEAMFHYRNVDVSTVKGLAQRWAPSMPEVAPPRKEHRVIPDLLDSLGEIQHYARHFLNTDLGAGPR